MADRDSGAAMRRRQRRLRLWWRHEQQSIAAALATYQHHSAPRGQKKARAGEEGERTELHGDDPGDPLSQPELFQLCEEEPGGTLPDRLASVRPQERVARHAVEQIVGSAPGLPMLVLCR